MSKLRLELRDRLGNSVAWRESEDDKAASYVIHEGLLYVVFHWDASARIAVYVRGRVNDVDFWDECTSGPPPWFSRTKPSQCGTHFNVRSRRFRCALQINHRGDCAPGSDDPGEMQQ